MNFEFLKGKKIFITGHTGFKGSWLCKILLKGEAIVSGYALEPNTETSLFELLNLKNKMDSNIGDIRDYEKLFEVISKFQPEIIIHLAAQPIVRESYSDPLTTFSTNVMGTANILECVRKIESVKSFLNVTTDKVYLNKEWEYGYRENEMLCGQDPYSNSKSCSELVTYSYKESFFKDKDFPRISTARAGNVLGGGDFAKDRIMTDAVDSYLNKKDIVVRNPFSTRPYQHVLDCLNGYLKIIELQYKDKKYEGSYNIGPDEENCVRTGDLVNIFCSTINNEISWINKHDGGPHEAQFLKLDNSKSKTILGWYPTWNIKTTIEKIIEWVDIYKENKDIEKIMDKQIEEFIENEKQINSERKQEFLKDV